MPTWLIVLLFLPVGLWFAYCVLRPAFGLSLCAHCVISWIVGVAALGAWLVYSGLAEGVEIRVVLGVTIVTTASIVGGIVGLALHLGAKRARTPAPTPAGWHGRSGRGGADRCCGGGWCRQGTG